MQGTSYSAELFSRLMAWGLRGLEARWDRLWGPLIQGIKSPHMLLFADDVMGFARSPEELQGKLIDVQDCLGAMGLHVNSDKCAVFVFSRMRISRGLAPRLMQALASA